MKYNGTNKGETMVQVFGKKRYQCIPKGGIMTELHECVTDDKCFLCDYYSYGGCYGSANGLKYKLVDTN